MLGTEIMRILTAVPTTGDANKQFGQILAAAAPHFAPGTIALAAMRPLTGVKVSELLYSVCLGPTVSSRQVSSPGHTEIYLKESVILRALRNQGQGRYELSTDPALEAALGKPDRDRAPVYVLGRAILHNHTPIAYLFLVPAPDTPPPSEMWETLVFGIKLAVQRLFFLYQEKDRLQETYSTVAGNLRKTFSSENPGQADALQIVLDSLLKLLQVEKCALFLVDYSGKSLVLEKAAGKINFDQIRKVATYSLENYDPHDLGTGVTPWVLFRKKPFNARNFRDLQHNSEGHWKGNWDDVMYRGREEASRNFQCVYMVPLLAGGDSIGVLKCENRTGSKTYFDQADERLVDMMAQLISNLVISQRIERNRYDYALPLVSNSLVAHFGQRGFYEKLLDECKEILNAEVCSLFLVDGKGNLTLKEIVGLPDETKAQLRDFTYGDYKTARGLTPWILRRRAAFNVRSYPDLKGRSEDMHIGAWDSIVYGSRPEERFKSLYSIPLIVGDKPIGVFKIENKTIPPYYFTESDERLFDLIGRMIAIGAVYDNEKYIGVMLRAADAGFLASGIAHEFNNDLQRLVSIAGNIEELASGDSLSKLARTLIEEAKRAAKTIEDFRQIRSSKEEVQEVDPDQTVQRLLSLSKERCRNNNIKLNYRNEGVHRVQMNETELQTILINLLNNAFEAITGFSSSGIVDVAIRPVAGGFFQVEVSDSGRGISEEEREFIFTPFYTTKGPKGMGIGLYWVQRLVNGSGGTIRVESPNSLGGTSFLVDMPVATDVGGTHG